MQQFQFKFVRPVAIGPDLMDLWPSALISWPLAQISWRTQVVCRPDVIVHVQELDMLFSPRILNLEQ